MSITEPRNADRDSPIPKGEFAFTWSDFRKIAALIHAHAGIVLGDNKVNLVYSRLTKRLRLLGLSNFRDYCKLVQSEDGVDERQAMIAAMTTNVTSFFREAHHFHQLTKEVLPPLVAAAKRGERIRIWSAGCSSGEEPYSIALTILDAMPDAAKHDVLILATDLDPNMIARAEDGIYRASQVESIPPALRKKYVIPTQDGGELAYRVSDAVRELVRYRELNLLQSWPMKGRFEIIFCRNVMIYFDDATQESIWRRFGDNLQPGGHLFIGHSERIDTDRLPYELAGQTCYRLQKKGAR